MPSIAESLRKVGYLHPMAQGFKEFADQMQQEREQEDFNKTLSAAFDQMKSNLKVEEDYAPQKTSALRDLMPQGTRVTALSGALTGGADQQVPIEEARKVKSYTQMTPQEQLMRNKQLVADMAVKLLGMKHLPQGVANQGLQALQMGAEAYQQPIPTHSLKAIPAGGTLTDIETDPITGEIKSKVVAEGMPKKEQLTLKGQEAEKDYPEFGIRKGEKVTKIIDKQNPDKLISISKEHETPDRTAEAFAYAEKKADEKRKRLMEKTMVDAGSKLNAIHDNIDKVQARIDKGEVGSTQYEKDVQELNKLEAERSQYEAAYKQNKNQYDVEFGTPQETETKKTDIAKKYSTEYNGLIKRGASPEKAIELIKKQYKLK